MTIEHADISDGLTPERRTRILRNRASNFQLNPEYEQLLTRIEKDPAYADTISPAMRMSLGMYENDKTAANDTDLT
ncbi:hypothetical protein YW5DRAFT_01906 [Streptomyces sp. Ncost-T6T-1]|uniref:hypothetical protein n=1 Tax=Streptomyces sp. Ncost-T6T-1 TaxID=1100828 RepID=UPI00080480D9|nr:hypothetical protein [Streptomyces sp. Ncost-T6T-1]SBV00571.1 hypothetical protein YW5DRAFT_01906 [Streptomyces sp. Ncost-T6T-1]